jgi:hypothetical protein
MPAATLILTITPDRSVLVSLRHADGASSPVGVIPADLDWRLAGFVADMHALAQEKLAALKATAVAGAADDDPAIAVHAARGEQVRWRCHHATT